MRHNGRETALSQGLAGRPQWSAVLRAVREARTVTQDGWAARLGVSRRTVQRWERGELAPDTVVEAAIASYCAEKGLFRTFQHGPLQGLALSPELLRDLLTEARLAIARGGEPYEGAVRPAPGARCAPCRPPTRVARAGRPAAPGSSAGWTNLPDPFNSFVGREREIAEVRRLLATTRLLTLTGTGGAGKTRLALEVARGLLDQYRDGVWLAELAPLPAAECAGASARACEGESLVTQAVATALRIQEAAGRSPADRLTAALEPRHTLLVLDNCEHVVAACARLAETLLQTCPRLTLLVTSREPLGICGETRYSVPALTLPPEVASGAAVGQLMRYDAVQLFVERAHAVQPGFALADEHGRAVAAICRRLDGIPLALELAAARVAALSVQQIAARLDDRFRLLTAGCRTGPPRQQTLRATIDWSWDLLSEPERVMLRRLGVFAGGWTLEAAEAVCAGEEIHPADVLDLLAQLVNKSLVITDVQGETMRYRLLETIRRYAEDKLSIAGEGHTARARHLQWCLTLAETAERELGGPAQGWWLEHLEQEHDNLRAALSWALTQVIDEAVSALRLAGALHRFWELRGYLREGRQRLAQALEAGRGAPALARAKGLQGAGVLAYMQGDYAAARLLTEASLRHYREAGNGQGIAEAKGNLGRTALRQGDFVAAHAFLEASLALHVQHRHRPGIADVQFTLGVLALRQGDYGRARERFQASLGLYRELEHKDGIANALEELATVAGEQGDHEQHAELLQESLALYRELGRKGGVAVVLGHLGLGAWSRGDYNQAWALLEEGLTLYQEVGDRRGIARLLGSQSLVALSQQDYARAAGLCRESLTLYGAAGDIWALGRYLPVLAGAVFGQGQPQWAAQLFAAGAELRERLGAHLPPIVRLAHDRTVAAVRTVLDERSFATAWQGGRAMTVEQVLACALDGVPASGSPGETAGAA